MKRGTKNHWTVGRRVQIPAYTDLWMRGARYGTVERFVAGTGRYLDPRDPRGADLVRVRMDNPRVTRLVTVIFADCQFEERAEA